MTLMPGTALQNGKYVIQTLLDTGEQGLTYLAFHSHLQDVVRLRTLATLPPESERSASFMNLGRRLYHCHHPHLARLLDLFVEADQPFWVIEQPQGTPLVDYMTVHPLTQAEALRYVHQVGSAIAALHDQGCSHGNVSPQTVVMTAENPANAVLVGVSVEDRNELTHEQRLNDVRDLARLLYFTLTGRSLPNHALLATSIDIIPALHHLHEQQPHLTPAVEQALLKALQADPPPFATVTAWLASLPQAIAPALPTVPASTVPTVLQSVTQAQTSSVPQAIAPVPVSPSVKSAPAKPVPQRSPLSPKRSSSGRWFPVAVGMVSLLAAMGGAGLGMSLRFDSPDNARRGGSLFNNEQAFPPSEQWPGESIEQSEASGDYLFESAPENYDYGGDYYAPEGGVPEYVPAYEDVPSYSDLPVDGGYGEEEASIKPETPAAEPSDLGPDAGAPPLDVVPVPESKPDVPVAPSEPPAPEPAFEAEPSVVVPGPEAMPLSGPTGDRWPRLMV